jgi:hypothetical protein
VPQFSFRARHLFAGRAELNRAAKFQQGFSPLDWTNPGSAPSALAFGSRADAFKWTKKSFNPLDRSVSVACRMNF